MSVVVASATRVYGVVTYCAITSHLVARATRDHDMSTKILVFRRARIELRRREKAKEF